MSGCREEEGGKISKYDKTINNEAKKKNYSIIKYCVITSFRI